ncbi:MAG TPA: PAS domain S-box protein [Acidobacteriaceae bacterium]|nr:PAS domain S-box protein [Acidobacteriaceae bacterium]
MEDPIPRFSRSLAAYLAAVVLSLLAIRLTYHFHLFSGIPWTLSLFSVALVAWIGGVFPAAVTTLFTTCGVYALVLAPASGRPYSATILGQGLAFDAVALFMAYLISQRNRAVSLLATSEMHYRSMTETAPDVLITIDSDSRILSINPAVREIFGYEPSELIGQELLILMPDRYRAAHKQGIARYLATGVRKLAWTGVQLPGRRKNGEEIPLEISFGSYMSDGEPRFTGFIRNVSDRRNAEAALMQSEKLAAVGRLASSIAHEINNPLEAVTNLLYLSEGTQDVAEIHGYVKAAEREVRRVSVIANQTLQFHGRSNTPVPVPCEELVDASLALFQGRLLNARISVMQRQRAKRLAVCIEGETRQVLNNLIGNAIDALPPDGGRILVRSRDATDWSTGRTGVVLTVADTGAGMNRETVNKIFDAFFSTKGMRGAGLGLWICSQLVERSHGALRVRSSQHEGRSGTVFTLFLPSEDE